MKRPFTLLTTLLAVFAAGSARADLTQERSTPGAQLLIKKIRTGHFSEIFDGGFRGSLKKPSPQKELVYAPDGHALAAMYQISDKPKAFLFSRHLLRQNAPFAESLKKSGQKLYEFSIPRNGRKLDVVLAIEGESTSELLKPEIDKNCYCVESQIKPKFSLIPPKNFAEHEIREGQEFYASLVSTVGDASGNLAPINDLIALKEVSVGTDSAFTRAYLAKDTGPGSSGGLVYVKDNGWKVGGVIACHKKAVPVAGKNHETLPGMELITVKALGAAEVAPITADEIASEKQEFNPKDCSPVDNRGGGGLP